MCFAFPFCNFFYLPQTKQLCLHLMDQRTNVTFAVIDAIKIFGITTRNTLVAHGQSLFFVLCG